MKRCLPMLFLLFAAVAQSGMTCMGTGGPPDDDPNNDPPPGGSLIIKSVAADAVKDELLINGEFGDEEGLVSLNGTTLTVKSWPAAGPLQQIVCDLPREAHGNVQVQVGSEFSNVAQLTKWELTLVSKTRIFASAPSSGQHNIDITATFIIRSCLNNLLDSNEPFGAFASVSRASTAVFDASGTINNPGTGGNPNQHITLSKQEPQQFLIVYPGDTVGQDEDRFSARNFVCGATRGSGGGIKLLFSIAGFYKVTDQVGMDVNVGEHATGYATNTYFDTSQPILFFFDEGFNIVGGSVAAMSDPNSTLEWQLSSPESPPQD